MTFLEKNADDMVERAGSLKVLFSFLHFLFIKFFFKMVQLIHFAYI